MTALWISIRMVARHRRTITCQFALRAILLRIYKGFTSVAVYGTVYLFAKKTAWGEDE